MVPPIYREATTAEENRKFEQENFGTLQLPLYVILKPLANGKFQEVDRYVEGKINNEDAFAKFLEEPLNPRIAGLRAPSPLPLSPGGRGRGEGAQAGGN